MQTIVEIVTDIVNALHNDENKGGLSFKAWSFAEFGKYPHIYISFDNLNPPLTNPVPANHHYPLLTIFSSESDIGETKNPVWSVLIAFMVVNAETNYDESEDMPVFEHKGFLQVEAFRQQCEFAILRANLKTAVDVAGSFSPEEMNHPLYISYSSVSPQGTKDYNESQPSES